MIFHRELPAGQIDPEEQIVSVCVVTRDEFILWLSCRSTLSCWIAGPLGAAPEHRRLAEQKRDPALETGATAGQLRSGGPQQYTSSTLPTGGVLFSALGQ